MKQLSADADIVDSEVDATNMSEERSVWRATARHHHATATAAAGTGVLDCDGSTAGVSASLLNICSICQSRL
jgi:hypothetical protein